MVLFILLSFTLSLMAEDFLPSLPLLPPLPEDLSDSCREIISSHGLVLDSKSQTVSMEDSSVSFSHKEFSILYLLACHPGRVYTSSELFNIFGSDEKKTFYYIVNRPASTP